MIYLVSSFAISPVFVLFMSSIYIIIKLHHMIIHIISFIFIPRIHTGLQNPYGYGNSHICLRSLEVKSV